MPIDQTPQPQWQEWNQVGENNANLQTSTTRMLEGKSWLKTDTVILLPAAEMVPMRCAVTWMNMMKPPNQSVPTIPLLGMEVGDAYSQAIQGILAHPELSKHKYVLTIEHDNSVPVEGLTTLIRHMENHPEYACVGGLYWTKGPGGVPQIWGDVNDPLPNFRPQPPIPNCKCGRKDCPLVECKGTGMGFNLWRMSMLADPKFPAPLFKTKCSATEGVGTQDLSFWGEARKLGYRCAIACDVLVGHYDIKEKRNW